MANDERPKQNPAPQPTLARPLRLVDDDGQIHDACPRCEELQLQLDGAENNVRSMRAQMGRLKAELAGDVDSDHALFPAVIALFRYWQERCNHPRTEFTPAHMKAALARVKEHGVEKCRTAIRGAEFDPFITWQKNGRRRLHNDWFQIMAADKFESFVNRAPDPPEITERQQTLIDTANEVAERATERARLFAAGKDPVAAAHFLLEVDRLIIEWREAGA